MSLEKLVKTAFVNRFGITAQKKAVEAFTRRFFEKHNIAQLLEDASDGDYLAALKAVVAGGSQSTTDDNPALTSDPSAATTAISALDGEKPKGGRKS